MQTKKNMIRVSSLASLAAAALFLAAGCATSQKYGEFTPKGEIAATSNADEYSTYRKAMAHTDGFQMAYEWQKENPKLVEDATKPELLAWFVATPKAADSLLAKIGTAYDGDPVALTQIAAVTQLVMCPKCPKSPARRTIWVAALERARDKTDDGYVRTFCDQQLRLCK